VAADPTSASATTAGTPLHLLILGSKTQTQRALEAQPTFASIWIGNNDVLGPALTGLLGPTAGVTSGLTSVASFQASYKAMMDQLVQGAPGLKGVLIGVVQVSQTPVFVPASALSNPLVLAAIAANTGRPVTVDQACAASGALVVLRIVEAIRTGQHPPFISCTKNVPAAPIGDLFVLDAAEQTTLRTTVDAYNAYIRSQADANGFAYYDPNVLLAARKAAGEIPVLPNFTSATQPFGPLLSLDGVHPSSAAHRLIANELVAVINAKYGTGLGGIQ
jgi:lysophospholipase L1-like esterase